MEEAPPLLPWFAAIVVTTKATTAAKGKRASPRLEINGVQVEEEDPPWPNWGHAVQLYHRLSLSSHHQTPSTATSTTAAYLSLPPNSFPDSVMDPSDLNNNSQFQSNQMPMVCYRDLTPDDAPDDADDHFDRLPDSLLLLVFNAIADVKSLGRCCLVSRRFHSLVPHVHSVVVHVDCVISDDDPSSSPNASPKSRPHLLSLFRSLFSSLLFKPLHALSHLLLLPRPNHPPNPNPNPNTNISPSPGPSHHSPTQVLNNFRHLKSLRIELPTGELGVDDGVLLKWRAQFGSTLDNCVILGASSVTRNPDADPPNAPADDSGSIPESFYTNGGLKLRVVWTISSLIAASARHYLLQPIIADHRGLDSLVLTDADGQGVLCMDKEHLEELRVKPLSASTASKRTLVPALNMRLWYAAVLELPCGIVLKGATLVAIRPNEDSGVAASKKDVSDVSWIADSFVEPYVAAARMLVKRRTYCLEMNSF